jgi:hypothetical protein
MQVLNIEKIKEEYSFLYEDKENNKDIYFCNCGEVIIIDKKNDIVGEKNDIVKIEKDNQYKTEALDDDYFTSLYKSIELSNGDYYGVKCPKCNKNFSTINNQEKLIMNNNFFISGYNVLNTNDELTLYYTKIKPNIIKNDSDYNLEFSSKDKYLKYDKITKKTYFKAIDIDEKEFYLSEIIKVTDNIFKEEVNNIYNLYYIQIYINNLAKYVIDINNTNVIEELLGEVKNRFNHAGLDSIKKIISIFMGIIKYSNLSTIALTKGCKFLYDLMRECDIPNVDKLKENNLTSPIPIFNYLVGNYIKKINEEVNEDNKETHEFLFKSSKIIKMEIDIEADLKRKLSKKKEEVKSFEVIDTGEEKEMKIVYTDNKNYKTKVSHNSDANKFQVMEISSDANASKFIYKSINNFLDYKQLLKFFKFYNKHQIVTLLQKYNLNLLTKVIDLIYYRDSVDIKEFDRIMNIINDYTIQETLKYKPTLNNENFVPDYSNVSKFDFVYYDDSIMMMEVLKFDPRKEFNKIKTYGKLKEYHDNLVKFFNVVSDEEKNTTFKNFVNRFKFLESREDYDGYLELKLITTPGMLINEGVQMKHSASSYSRKVITESYVIGQIFDNSPNLNESEFKRFTIGFSFDSVNGLEFDQAKSFGNKSGSDRFKKLLMEFLVAKDISYRPIKDLKLLN